MLQRSPLPWCSPIDDDMEFCAVLALHVLIAGLVGAREWNSNVGELRANNSKHGRCTVKVALADDLNKFMQNADCYIELNCDGPSLSIRFQELVARGGSVKPGFCMCACQSMRTVCSSPAEAPSCLLTGRCAPLGHLRGNSESGMLTSCYLPVVWVEPELTD